MKYPRWVAMIAMLLNACTRDAPVSLLPNKLTYIEYAGGRIVKEIEIHEGERPFDALNNMLKENQHGWKRDWNTYAPQHYFKGDSINVTCNQESIVINYRGDDGNWIQLSKKVPGCGERIRTALKSESTGSH